MKKTFFLFWCINFTLSFYFAAAQNNSDVQANRSIRYHSFEQAAEKYAPNQFAEIFAKFLQTSESDGFELYESSSDEYGFTHDEYRQYFRGLKVENASYFVHSRNNRVEYINGEYHKIKLVSLKAELSEKEALLLVLKTVGAKRYAWDDHKHELFIKELFNDEKASSYPSGELLIVKNYNLEEQMNIEKHHLCYKFSITALEPDLHETVYIDAQTGEVVQRINETCNATGDAATRYNGTKNISSHTTRRADGKYILKGNGVSTMDLLNGAEIAYAIEFTDNNNEWMAAEFNNARKDNIALNAQWAGGLNKKYWNDVHGRNSYNNLGGEIRLFVHYGTSFTNARWNSTNNENQWGYAIFGDGDGIDFNPFASLDIVSHEIGHGINYSCGIKLSVWTSRAIDEGLADIWAICVENRYAPNKVWHIGEDICNKFIGTEKALRLISNPKSSNHADTYEGTYFSNSRYTASTVVSHWFYIASQGKTGTNDKGQAYAVQGISIDKVEKILYNAVKNNINAVPNFSDMANMTLQSAKNIYGNCSQEAKTIADAWYAVGVNLQTVPSNPSISGGLSVCNYIISVNSIGASSYTWTIPELGIYNSTTTSNTYSVSAGTWIGFSQLNVTCVASNTLGCRSASRTFNRPSFPTNPPCNMRMAAPSIKAYPNPTDDLLTVELLHSDNPILQAELFDVHGNNVLQEENKYFDAENRFILSLKRLPDGIYFLAVLSEDGRRFSQKIIVQKGKIAD